MANPQLQVISDAIVHMAFFKILPLAILGVVIGSIINFLISCIGRGRRR